MLSSLRRRLGGSHPRDSTPYASDAVPGEVADLFHAVRHLPGYFTYDDCVAFLLVLRLQTALGVLGNALEIGSYHGRSTAVIAHALQRDEELFACDAFELETDHRYPELPTPDRLLHNVTTVNPGFSPKRLQIFHAYSSELALDDSDGFRFVHIDGGHSRSVALHDLELARRHLIPGGVVVVDDFAHPRWPEVSQAVCDFQELHAFRRLLDVNRIGASGRKLYLQAPLPSATQ